jgi:hypothetical protein
MKESKAVLKMPEWFDIKNYDACIDMTPREWAEQLKHRAHFMEELTVDGSIDLECYGNGYRQGDLLDQTRQAGIVTIKSYGQEDTEKFKKAENDSIYWKFSKISTSAIYPIKTYLLAIVGASAHTKVEAKMKGEDKAEAKKAYESYMRAPYDAFRSEYPDDDGMFMPKHAWAAIDMSLPDKVTLDQMKTFLPAYRKALGIEVNTKQPTPENIKKLLEYKVTTR